jgi:hypothetical protein
MSLVHGSQGLIYFVHEWQPKFNESALLSDAEMLTSVKAVNLQIHRLAPVLNQPAMNHLARVTTANTDAPVALLTKRHEGALYLFAVAMSEQPATATFTLSGLPGKCAVEVLDEERTLDAAEGVFSDQFDGWAVHLYRLKGLPAKPTAP